MLPLTKLAELEDFADPEFRDLLRSIYPHDVTRFGPDYPTGAEVRKAWEIGAAVRTLTTLGAVRPDAEILGVGAGNEPTSFHLTTRVRRVFATDLYLGPGWQQSANAAMLTDPGRYWPAAWDPHRLVVQHMDGRELLHPDGSFDGIFSSGSIEHFGGPDDVRRSSREMYRVLKPGGVLSISTEFRLAGPPPGLPGTLMFDEGELRDLIVRAAGWEVVGSLVPRVSEATWGTVQNYDDLLADVGAHIAEHGAIFYHRLRFGKYPVLLVRHDERVWGSVHLALRKPG
jgi:SAM-dependent methyltransferase